MGVQTLLLDFLLHVVEADVLVVLDEDESVFDESAEGEEMVLLVEGDDGYDFLGGYVVVLELLHLVLLVLHP